MNSLLVDIPKRSSSCFLGNESLRPGDEYYSALVEDERTETLVRQDFCPSCWKHHRMNDLKSYWKAKVPPVVENTTTIDHGDQRALVLLRNFLEIHTKEAGTYAFVLAHYLARKKLLILRKEFIHEGEEAYFYEVAETEEMLSIKKIPLIHLDSFNISDLIAHFS